MVYARNIRVGIANIVLSLSIGYSIIFYDKNVSTPFVASTISTNSVLSEITAYCAGVITQFFGLCSYVLVVILFVRGMLNFFGSVKKQRFQRLWLFLFLMLSTILYNVASTYPMFQDILSTQKFDCYAGGYIGYSLSKIVFIDILHQMQVCKWQVVLILIILVWLLQYVWGFDYVDIFNFGKKCSVKKINKNINNLLTKLKVKTFLGKLSNITSFMTNKVSKKSKARYVTLSSGINRDVYKKNDDNPRNYENNDVLLEDESDNLKYDSVIHTSGVSDLSEDNQAQEQEVNNEMDYRTVSNNQSDEFVYLNKSKQYVLPSVDLLDKPKHQLIQAEDDKVLSEELIKVLDEFSIKGEIISVKPGPVITMFEFKPAAGIKTSRIISLSEDIARSMSAFSARISTIPGKNAIGIELPNKERQTVYLSELLANTEFIENEFEIPLVLGKDIAGTPVFADLAKMPHLLIAGTTGSGKSVSINGMIISILFKFKPNECKLIMIDPKMLELSVYADIPHLLIPVVTEPKKAVDALQWAVSEMEQRYRNMAKFGVRNIDGFNSKLKNAQENPDLLVRNVQVGFDPDTGRPIFETQKLEFEFMPYIVIVVDEMADLMTVAGKDVETAIQRLSQMARAAGIHLIMATQRPSVDVITGTIKANFPTRISFQVTSKIDSRTILSEQGAEQLLGQGDMLYMSGAGRIKRIHGSFVNDDEIERVVNFIKSQALPCYANIVSKSNNGENCITFFRINIV